MGKSKIEWTDVVWNPVTGCTKISPGCKNCYAERMSKRLAGRAGYPRDNPFRVTLHPDRLGQPLRWKKPRRVFVCSMGDLFHHSLAYHYISAVFGVMAVCQQHTFIVLTKRPQIMKKYFDWLSYFGGSRAFQHPSNQLRACCDAIHQEMGYIHNSELFPSLDTHWPLPNVHLGVTAENQEMFDKRWAYLKQIPAAVYIISYEPALGPLVLPPDFLALGKRAWLVCGGESGPGARPMHPDWPRKVRDDCVAAGVPFFFKQQGEWGPDYLNSAYSHLTATCPQNKITLLDKQIMLKIGKKAAGRELDGQVWDQLPEPLK